MTTAIIPVSHITKDNYLTNSGAKALSGWDTIPTDRRAASNWGAGILKINQELLSDNIRKNWIISSIDLYYNAWIAMLSGTFYVRMYDKNTSNQSGGNLESHSAVTVYDTKEYKASIPLSYYDAQTRQLSKDIGIYIDAGFRYAFLDHCYFVVNYTETSNFVVSASCDSKAGQVSVSPNDGLVDPENPNDVILTAIARDGYTFSKWINSSGATVSTVNTYTVSASSITTNLSYTAKFIKNTQIKIGNSTIPTSAYVGKKTVKEIYIGSKLVYKKDVI